MAATLILQSTISLGFSTKNACFSEFFVRGISAGFRALWQLPALAGVPALCLKWLGTIGAVMATINSRKIPAQAERFEATIRRHIEGKQIHRESQTFDTRQEAAGWVKRRERRSKIQPYP